MKYSHKKVYYRSYEKDSEDFTKTRYWLTFHMFHEKYLERKFVVFMDESGINNTSFKQKCYSKKGKKKILHGRARVKCKTLILAISKEGHELHQFL